MSKQTEEGAYTDCERCHPAAGLSSNRRSRASQAAAYNLRAPLYKELLLLLCTPGQARTPSAGLALKEMRVGTASTKLQ